MTTTHPPSRWLAAKDLVVDGVEHGSRVVERSQQSLARRIFGVLGAATGRGPQLGRYEDIVALGLAMGHQNVRSVSRLTSMALDSAHQLARVARADSAALGANSNANAGPIPLRSDVTRSSAWRWDGFVGVANGIVGDHLASSGNPLAIDMALRVGDVYLDLDASSLTSLTSLSSLLPDGAPRIAVFVHGLSATEWSWAWDAQRQHGAADVNYGSLLAAELGVTPVYVRYNGGLHISDNGQRLAGLLQQLADRMPGGLGDIALIGHSMGGLVAQSAAHYGRQAGHRWVEHVRQVISIAAPHDGAPLEKFGNLVATVLGAIDTPGTRIPADVIDARSAGIKDLRHGYIIDDDWRDADPDVPLADRRSKAKWLDGVPYHRIVSTLTADPQHPLGQLVGDTMVRPRSAAAVGPLHPAAEHPGEIARVGGISHIGLANHPAVYAHLRRWLEDGERRVAT